MVSEYNENTDHDRSLPPGAIDLSAPVAEAAPAAPVVVNPAGETTHDADEGVLIISSPSGKGERQITVAQWPRFAASEREWAIKHSNYTGAHHSDNY